MPTWQRWTFHDPNTGVTYTFPINPKQGGDRSYDKNFGYQGTVAPDGVAIFYEGQDAPGEIAWNGVFLDTASRDAMIGWYAKRTQVQVTNHLGEQTWIYITSVKPTVKRAATRRYKADYEAHAFVLDVPAYPSDGGQPDSTYATVIDGGGP